MLSDTIAGIIGALVVIGVLSPAALYMYLLQRREDREREERLKHS